MVDVPLSSIEELAVVSRPGEEAKVILRFHADGPPVVSRDRHAPRGYHVALTVSWADWERIVRVAKELWRDGRRTRKEKQA
jgi:hypothetical protein